jgi:hypothetical protein
MSNLEKWEEYMKDSMYFENTGLCQAFDTLPTEDCKACCCNHCKASTFCILINEE